MADAPRDPAPANPVHKTLAAVRGALFAAHRKTVALPRIERVAAAITRVAGRADSILDVGCGDLSVGSRVAANLGARIAGVDVMKHARTPESVTLYDGLHLPFPDDAFDVVILADVLHHSTDPAKVLGEALRVAPVVALKDHFAFGPGTRALLYYMDRLGNAEDGIPVPGDYLEIPQWIDLVERAGGHVARLDWPLQIHDYPFRVVTRDALQFAARVERRAPRPSPASP